MPSSDVLIMGHILHDWDLEEKLRSSRKPMMRCPRAAL